jgi:sugar phosphate permease
MVDILAAPQQSKADLKTDASLRTLAAISVAHWVSHFHLFVLPMLFPFLKAQLGVGYIELGLALTVFGMVSALTQAPIGYLADHIGARKVLLIGLSVGGVALIMLGLHLSYTSLIVCAALLGLANSVYHPCDYAILSTHMDEARMGRAFSIHFCRLPRRRGGARDHGRARRIGRRPRCPDRGRRSRSRGGAGIDARRHSRCQLG